MLGYMTKQDARNLGFTHYGSLYSIPVYLTEGSNPNVTVKHPVMEYVLDFAEAIARSMQVSEYEIKYKGQL